MNIFPTINNTAMVGAINKREADGHLIGNLGFELSRVIQKRSYYCSLTFAQSKSSAFLKNLTWSLKFKFYSCLFHLYSFVYNQMFTCSYSSGVIRMIWISFLFSSGIPKFIKLFLILTGQVMLCRLLVMATVLNGQVSMSGRDWTSSLLQELYF